MKPTWSAALLILAVLFGVVIHELIHGLSLISTSAAGGDWLVLWLIRKVKAGMHVEDHPTNGCYVLES